ncbi:hypothetical protein [Lichenibacterium dinghuense]|uniref:hypothetical protein n=1 Tax=Lichenibacterium dinghuense TaxID=2895977 RepID=UPI001F2890EE|nr:hypothetical protein [Lichenibacterium sp. 6Y81]
MLLAAALFDAALLWAILRMVGQARVYESLRPPDDAAPSSGGASACCRWSRPRNSAERSRATGKWSGRVAPKT